MALLFQLVFLLHLLWPLSVFAQTCKNNTLSDTRIVYATCSDLPYLNSFLHWNYNNSANTAQIAYVHTNFSTNTWVAWAVNPTSTKMPGSQAFVAYLRSNGSLRVYKAPVVGYQTTLQEGQLSFSVSQLSVTLSKDNTLTIYATFQVPNNATTINQLWQQGPLSNDAPREHKTSNPNDQTMGTVDLLSGEVATSPAAAGNSRQKKRNIHGVLNTVSWGIMMPIGALIARYLKVAKSGDPAWFYIHVGCQSSAYIIGISGWATGIKLGSDSPGIEHTVHRNIGMTLFCLGLLQVLALFLRPDKEHKYRKYWNYYHHGVGYIVIILAIINIRKGMIILKAEQIWRISYVIFVVVLACISISLEVFTWFVMRKRYASDTHIQMGNGVNHGPNHGYAPQSY